MGARLGYRPDSERRGHSDAVGVVATVFRRRSGRASLGNPARRHVLLDPGVGNAVDAFEFGRNAEAGAERPPAPGSEVGEEGGVLRCQAIRAGPRCSRSPRVVKTVRASWDPGRHGRSHTIKPVAATRCSAWSVLDARLMQIGPGNCWPSGVTFPRLLPLLYRELYDEA